VRLGDYLGTLILVSRGYQSHILFNHVFHLENRWTGLRELGQGAYGLVISAQDSLSGETIAIKMLTRVFDKAILARRCLREITLLRHLNGHENVSRAQPRHSSV
jgi:mitogen-activated protein kinase 7